MCGPSRSNRVPFQPFLPSPRLWQRLSREHDENNASIKSRARARARRILETSRETRETTTQRLGFIDSSSSDISSDFVVSASPPLLSPSLTPRPLNGKQQHEASRPSRQMRPDIAIPSRSLPPPPPRCIYESACTCYRARSGDTCVYSRDGPRSVIRSVAAKFD